MGRFLVIHVDERSTIETMKKARASQKSLVHRARTQEFFQEQKDIAGHRTLDLREVDLPGGEIVE